MSLKFRPTELTVSVLWAKNVWCSDADARQNTAVVWMRRRLFYHKLRQGYTCVGRVDGLRHNYIHFHTHQSHWKLWGTSMQWFSPWRLTVFPVRFASYSTLLTVLIRDGMLWFLFCFRSPSWRIAGFLYYSVMLCELVWYIFTHDPSDLVNTTVCSYECCESHHLRRPSGRQMGVDSFSSSFSTRVYGCHRRSNRP